MEFEKWYVIRASVGDAGDVLAFVAEMGWVACFRGWRTSVGDMLLLLLLLLLKCYPEEKTVECLLLKQNEKIFQIDLNSDLKEEPELKNRCWFTLFEPVIAGSWIFLNLLKYARMCYSCLDMCNFVNMPEYA